MAYSAPPTKNTGDQFPASDWNTYLKDNFTELESRKDASYVQFTSNVSITATVEASSTTIVTAGAITANGTDIYEVEFFCPNFSLTANAGGNRTTFCLFDSSTQVGRFGTIQNDATTILVTPVLIAYRLTPTNASHTYSVRAFRTNANTTANAGSGGVGTDLPGYIRVRKVQ